MGGMQVLKVAVMGFGNVGRCAAAAIRAAPDLQLAGVVSRRALTRYDIGGRRGGGG